MLYATNNINMNSKTIDASGLGFRGGGLHGAGIDAESGSQLGQRVERTLHRHSRILDLQLPDIVPHPVISPLAIIESLLTLGLITVGAGMYPAQRAAALSPIECLRQE